MPDIPEHKETLSEFLRRLADVDRLQPTLLDIRAAPHNPLMPIASVDLELRIDVSSEEGLRRAASQLREIAAIVDAAADTHRPVR
jgi:hypothetical protein